MIEQNHECYVSLEVAKLLKEAGFNWLTHQYYGSTAYLKRTHTVVDPDEHKASAIYWKEDTALTFSGHRNDDSLSYSTPTLDVAQRWLREVKNISVDISSTCYSHYEYIIRKINQSDRGDSSIWALTACRFYTYEEAQEAGIKKALEIILEKGEQDDYEIRI